MYKASYDKDKATTWIGGQIRLKTGDLVKFEFSPDKQYGGGQVRIVTSEGECSPFMSQEELVAQASGFFGSKLKDLLTGGRNLFSGLVEKEPPKVK